MIKDIGAEVDRLALELRELSSQGGLSHAQAARCERCRNGIAKLLLEYARKFNRTEGMTAIQNKDYVDSLVLFQVMQRTLQTFLQNKEQTYFPLFVSQYKFKLPDIKVEYIEQNSYEQTQGLVDSLLDYIKRIGIAHGLGKAEIGAELKKRRRYPDYGKVEKFARSIGCTEDELSELGEIFAASYATNMDALFAEKEGTPANSAEDEAILRLERRDGEEGQSLWERILFVTRQEACKQGQREAEYMRGYWTIRMIENQIGQEQARLWKIYLMLLFFIAHEQLFDRHGELMDLMAEEFGIKRRAWHNHYKKAYNDSCRFVRKFIRM